MFYTIQSPVKKDMSSSLNHRKPMPSRRRESAPLPSRGRVPSPSQRIRDPSPIIENSPVEIEMLPSDGTLTALTSITQMEKSRFVDNSPATQILAESLHIEQDRECYSDGTVLPEKVPTVSDIPRPSIVASELGSLLGDTSIDQMDNGMNGPLELDGTLEMDGTLGMDRLLADIEPAGKTIFKGSIMTPVDFTPTQACPDTVYTEVERRGSERVEPPPVAIDTTPIYSKIIREKPRSPSDVLMKEQGSVGGGSSVRLSELTPHETDEVVDFIHRKVASVRELEVGGEEKVSYTGDYGGEN